MKINQTPDLLYGELFDAVQGVHLFGDSKTFVDAVPLRSPEEIVDDFCKQKNATTFDLNEFVIANFRLPENSIRRLQISDSQEVDEYIDLMWDLLTRARDQHQAHSSLLALPNPYVVPGGRFREIYYWDSYFTILGLANSGRQDLVRNMVDNFAFLIDQIGFIPNGNRSYYCTRSQTPFFAMMVQLLAQESSDDGIYSQYLPQLRKEYDFWMTGAEQLDDKNSAVVRVIKCGDVLLNRYWDNADIPRQESYEEDVELAQNSLREDSEIYRDVRAAAESGWDFSSRWFAEAHDMETIQTTQVIPVDLNCVMYKLEAVLSQAYAISGETENAALFKQRANARAQAIQQLFFNEETGLFQDLQLADFSFTKTLSIACSFPLFFNLASKQQAERVAERIHDLFLKPGGWVTSLNNSGQQWDLPNGWAPTQWVTYRGLQNYGYMEEANTGARRWIDNNLAVFRSTGKLLEKYNVVEIGEIAGGGEYEVQDGFGWTNAVLSKMMAELDL